MRSAKIRAVLDGQASYDALDGREQAAVRAEWQRRMDLSGAELDLAAEFAAAGVDGWVEADDDGQAVVHRSAGSTRSTTSGTCSSTGP